MADFAALGRVLVAGASGLVGRALLQARAEGPNLALVRRELDGLPAELVVRPDLLALEALPPVDTVLLALGTTRAQAGSLKAQEKVDRHMMVAVAEAGLAAGAKRVGVVSSAGADPDSWMPYLAMKGRMEQEVGKLGFERTVIVRPGLLDGARAELDQPFRLGEALALGMLRPFSALLPRSMRPNRVGDVAHGLLSGLSEGQGLTILEAKDLIRSR